MTEVRASSPRLALRHACTCSQDTSTSGTVRAEDLQDHDTLIRHYNMLLLGSQSWATHAPARKHQLRVMRYKELSMLPFVNGSSPSHRIEYSIQACRTPFCNPSICNQHIAPVAELCSPTQENIKNHSLIETSRYNTRSLSSTLSRGT